MLTLIRLSGVTRITESGLWVEEVGLVELADVEAGVGDLDVGVSGRLIVMLEGGRIGEMFSDCGDGRVLLLLVESFWREVDCVFEDFLDMDLLRRKILDLLVKYLSRLVWRWCLLMDLGSRRTTFW